MDEVVVVSGSVAAGHDGVAAELARRLRARGARVSRVDLLELLPARLGTALREVYRAQLGLPGSWDHVYALTGRRSVRALTAAAVTALTRNGLAAVTASASVVVATYPLAAQALGALRRHGTLAAPVAVYMTDMSVHPLWVAAGADLHLAVHPDPADSALRLGAAAVRVIAPATRPEFGPPRGGDAGRRRVRRRHGLPEDRPLVLVVAGSWGVGAITETVRDVARMRRFVPVALCGHNDALRHRIERDGAGVALGWTDEMGPLLGACDVVIQNAGGLTSWEALAVGVPVVSYRCIGGHGADNSRLLHRAGLVPLVGDAAALPDALLAAVRAGRNTGASELVRSRSDPADVVAALGSPAGGVSGPRRRPSRRPSPDPVS